MSAVSTDEDGIGAGKGSEVGGRFDKYIQLHIVFVYKNIGRL